MRRAIGFECIEGPKTGPVTRLRIKPATKLITKQENIKSFSIGPAMGLVGTERLLSS